MKLDDVPSRRNQPFHRAMKDSEWNDNRHTAVNMTKEWRYSLVDWSMARKGRRESRVYSNSDTNPTRIFRGSAEQLARNYLARARYWWKEQNVEGTFYSSQTYDSILANRIFMNPYLRECGWKIKSSVENCFIYRKRGTLELRYFIREKHRKFARSKETGRI